MQFPNKYNCLRNNEFVAGNYKIIPIRYEDRMNILSWRNEQMYHLRQNKLLTKESQDNYFNETIAAIFEQQNPNQILFSYLKNEKCIGYGGLVHIMPKYAFIFMIFSLAALGLPGTSGFVGEFLILVGVFQVSIIVTVLASLGIILAAAYMLWLYRRVVFGRITNSDLKNMKDLNKTELYIFSSLVILVIFFGIYPDPLFSTVDISINNLIENYQINLNFHLAQKGN